MHLVYARPFSITNPLISSLMQAEHPFGACDWSQPLFKSMLPDRYNSLS